MTGREEVDWYSLTEKDILGVVSELQHLLLVDSHRPVGEAPGIVVRLDAADGSALSMVTIELQTRFREAQFTLDPPTLLSAKSKLSPLDHRTVASWIEAQRSVIATLWTRMRRPDETTILLGQRRPKAMPHVRAGRLSTRDR